MKWALKEGHRGALKLIVSVFVLAVMYQKPSVVDWLQRYGLGSRYVEKDHQAQVHSSINQQAGASS